MDHWWEIDGSKQEESIPRQLSGLPTGSFMGHLALFGGGVNLYSSSELIFASLLQ